MDVPRSLLSTMRFSFLYVDRYLFSKGWAYPESYVPYCMVRYILKGSAVFRINGREYVVRENQIAYIPDGCSLACHALEDEFHFISIRFVVTARLNGNDFLTEFFHLSPIIDASDPDMLHYFQEVYYNATSERISRFFHIRGNLELILASMVDHNAAAHSEGRRFEKEIPQDTFDLEYIRHRETRSETIKRDPRIQIVVEYLIAHPEEPFDSKYLSNMAEMSPSSLRRHFKEHTGKSPGDFIKELRLMTAARRLLTTDERISHIAYELGFDDQNYFSRIFKAAFGVSPSQYRKISRE